MKSKKYLLVASSIFLILLLFVGSTSAADANETEVLSVDESVSMSDENLALDYSSDVSVESNGSNVLENDCDEGILQVPDSDDDLIGLKIGYFSFPDEIVIGKTVDFRFEIVNDDGSRFAEFGVFYLSVGEFKEQDYRLSVGGIEFKYWGEAGVQEGYFSFKTNQGNVEKYFNVTVLKVPTEINVAHSALELVIDDEVASGATLTPADAGNLTYNSGNSSVVIVENGKIKALGVGKTNITVSFKGNERYADAQDKGIDVTVRAVPRKNLTIEATAKSIHEGENASVVITGFENATGNITVRAGDGVYTKYIMGDVVSVDIPGLIENTVAEVYYNGDDDYNNASTSVLIVVYSNPDPSKMNLTIEATAEPITAGENATVLVTGLANASGKVTLEVPGQKPVEEYINGRYNVTFIVEGLDANTTAAVYYGGDVNYNPDLTTVDMIVNLRNASISADPDCLELFVGENGEIFVTTNPDGLDYNFTSSNESVVTVQNKHRVGKVIAVGEGNATITVTINEDMYYANSTTVDVIVKEDSRINVTAEDVTKYYGGSEAFVVNVTDSKGNGIPGQYVLITINGRTYNRTTDENGTARLNINLPSGDYDVNVTVGNVTVNSTVTVLSTIMGVTIKTGLRAITYSAWLVDSEGNPLENGTSVQFNMEGMICEGKVIGDNGEAFVDLVLNRGNHTITTTNPVTNEKQTNDIIIYSKDPNMNVKADGITVGENATVTVTVVVDATGNVTVGDEIVPVVNGTAVAVLSDLPVGNITVPVTYSGDNYYDSVEGSVNVTVNPKKTATISIDAPAITVGENATVTVTLPEDASGSVTVGDEIVPVVNGTAVAVLSDLPVGNITLPVTYSGDEKYNPIETEVNITVNEDTSDIIKAPDVTKYFGGPERFVVNVTDYQGNPLENMSVVININNKNYTRFTDENGSASIALNLPSRTYNATVTVENRTVNSTVTVLSTVNGTDIVKMYKNGTQYYATFLDSEGNYLAEGTTVNFNINGVFYERKVSGNKGLAKLNINLPAGEYIITAMNPKTGENTANNVTVLSTITENRDITKYFKNATKYTVKVIGADGKVVGAGEKVTFNINGVFYTRQTNESGIAALNINLPQGNYTVTAEYNDCKVSNNIEVLPILRAKDLTIKYGTSDQFIAYLVDGQGKPYPNQKVFFNINGVLYNRTTDYGGRAILNIKLGAAVNTYTITSSYNGCSIANTIDIVD
ncbi:MAG: hypothetical protein IK044_07710 [Methanobrevibacter sp.]|nr:hypothetical protein [Methanobrevibacter sp.]